MPVPGCARRRLIGGITTRCLSVSGPICTGVNSFFLIFEVIGFSQKIEHATAP